MCHKDLSDYENREFNYCTYAIVGLSKHFNNMAGFTFTPTSGDGCFHIGRKQSVFTDGLEFTIKAAHTGIWKDATGQIINKDKGRCNSIRFETSVSSDPDDHLNINLFLGRRKVVYDKDGHASILWSCEFHDELRNFLETKIGRDPQSPQDLKGTAKEVADRVLNEFFNGKIIVVEVKKDIFFKTVKDGVEKLEVPFDPVIVFKFKE